MKYKRILFATDFSRASDTAGEYAVSLARDSGATLLIVHVEEPTVSYPGGEMVLVYADHPNPVLHRMLERRVPKEANVNCELHLLQGHPADEIVRLASGHKVDLIVVGTHGRTGLTRVLVGSVAELIMRHAKCPVLVVKAAETLSDAVEKESPCEKPALVKPD